MFEETKMSIIMFIIIVVISIMILFVFGGYLLWNYHLGKPMAPFFWLRLKGWTQRGVALFEIFSLTNSVSLEEAKKEIGDGYRLLTPTTVKVPVKKPGKIKRFINFILARNITNSSFGTEKIKRIQNLIMPKSTYSINGVNTIPLWDLHPQLHTDILEGLKILVSPEVNIKTLKQLEEFISDPKNSEKILFKNYSYRKFYELYLGVRQKYNISVTTDDVANFIGKQFDKNFRESIEAKDFNAMQKSKTENKYMLYGYIAIILTIVIVGFKIIYQTIYG